MPELTVIFRTASNIEASVVQALLDSHGIESVRTSGPPASLFPFTVNPMGETCVSVREDDAPEAVRIIESHREQVGGGLVVPLPIVHYFSKQYLGRAALNLQQGNYREAIEDAREGARLAKSRTREAAEIEGIALIKSGRRDRGEQLLASIGVEYDPEYSVAALSYGGSFGTSLDDASPDEAASPCVGARTRVGDNARR